MIQVLPFEGLQDETSELVGLESSCVTHGPRLEFVKSTFVSHPGYAPRTPAPQITNEVAMTITVITWWLLLLLPPWYNRGDWGTEQNILLNFLKPWHLGSDGNLLVTGFHSWYYAVLLETSWPHEFSRSRVLGLSHPAQLSGVGSMGWDRL